MKEGSAGTPALPSFFNCRRPAVPPRGASRNSGPCQNLLTPQPLQTGDALERILVVRQHQRRRRRLHPGLRYPHDTSSSADAPQACSVHSLTDWLNATVTARTSAPACRNKPRSDPSEVVGSCISHRGCGADLPPRYCRPRNDHLARRRTFTRRRPVRAAQRRGPNGNMRSRAA